MQTHHHQPTSTTISFPPQITSTHKISQLSHGAFSNIYLLQSHATHVLYVLKLLPRTLHPERILSEINILHSVRNYPQINCHLLRAYHHDAHYFLKMNYVDGSNIAQLYHFSAADFRIYLRKCLEALRVLFDLGIIHWDIKQTNILYSAHLGSFSLIDFGLAREAHYRGCLQNMLLDVDSVLERMPKLEHASSLNTASRHASSVAQDRTKTTTTGTSPPRPPPITGKTPFAPHLFNVYPFERTGTVGFRAPELLIESQLVSDRMDVWSLGVVLASILCGRGMFFRGNWLCKLEAPRHQKYIDIIELLYVFGTDAVVEWLKKNASSSAKAKYYLDRVPKFKYCHKRSIKSICMESNRINPEICSGCIPNSLWDLLDHMLELDATKRWSAPQLLQHSFFQKGG